MLNEHRLKELEDIIKRKSYKHMADVDAVWYAMPELIAEIRKYRTGTTWQYGSLPSKVTDSGTEEG